MNTTVSGGGGADVRMAGGGGGGGTKSAIKPAAIRLDWYRLATRLFDGPNVVVGPRPTSYRIPVEWLRN